MRAKGKILSWNDKKGFGFVEPAAGGKRVFVHIKAFSDRVRRPGVDDVVHYTLYTDKQGRPCASEALLAESGFSRQAGKSRGLATIVLVTVFLLLVAATVTGLNVPPVIFAAYLAFSLFTFIVYARDKSAAVKGNWRTPESTLHMLSLIGGWPGALLAQRTLRHKSRKRSFQSVFWITVFVNCAAFVWLASPLGSSALQSLIAGG